MSNKKNDKSVVNNFGLANKTDFASNKIYITRFDCCNVYSVARAIHVHVNLYIYIFFIVT